jgi:hypothetical protein
MNLIYETTTDPIRFPEFPRFLDFKFNLYAIQSFGILVFSNYQIVTFSN